jgi:hypothetical protein
MDNSTIITLIIGIAIIIAIILVLKYYHVEVPTIDVPDILKFDEPTDIGSDETLETED